LYSWLAINSNDDHHQTTGRAWKATKRKSFVAQIVALTTTNSLSKSI